MADEAAPVVEKPAPPQGSGGSKMIMIVFLVIFSNAVGAGLTWFLVHKEIGKVQAASGTAESPKEDLAAALEKGAVVPLEPFVVNLADADTARYLRIKISLMIDDKAKAEGIVANQALQLKVRDIILQTLTRKTSQDLINDEGKNKLRQEIEEQVKPYFVAPKLTDVMFTEFVIQL